MGSEFLDKRMNGQGIQAADGTPVYPGMVAAPASYPFGTTIKLDGIGTVVVHDRGGAINVLDGDVHRIDLWVGSGEEGLARALAFGKKTVRGTIASVAGGGSAALDLSSLSAKLSVIEPYDVSDGRFLGLKVENGQTSLSVKRLQTALSSLGYFDHEITGKFGAVTADALAAFNREAGIASEPSDRLSDRTAAVLDSLLRRGDQVLAFGAINPDSSAADILAAKRTLRYLGLFRGRTTPDYDDALFNAILAFQRSKGLVADASSPGAGRIGPKTLPLVQRAWKLSLSRQEAEKRLLTLAVRDRLAARGQLLTDPLTLGSKGAQVSLLQRLLAGAGLLPAEKVTGTYGDQTKAAVAEFQKDHELVGALDDPAAGRIGPVTLGVIQSLQLKEAIARVRADGVAAL
jgi:peptidoglycan hydrolase-like protein with peptidoglycan-binding domain/3D (Asp-Asp-Asp) domain-containing protein